MGKIHFGMLMLLQNFVKNVKKMNVSQLKHDQKHQKTAQLSDEQF